MQISTFKFLISYEFYSKIGFFISFTVTSLLVLEIVRLVYTDVNKRDVEKLLDAYSRSRNGPIPERRSIPIDELEKRPYTPQYQERRTPSPAATPGSERTVINSERRRRATSSASQKPVAEALLANYASASPRRLRKRSDTLNSSSSSESRKLEKRRREGSPASVAGSKASSRGGSPSSRRVKDKEAQQLSSSLHKLLQRSK